MISNHFIENNFPKGIVTLVGARPAIGKSAFAISMAINLARRNQKFIYFSLEMDKERVIDRIKLQTDEKEYASIKERFIIDDTPGLKISQVRKQLETAPADYIFIDCPPAVGLLTMNALVASDSVIIPVQCEYLALEGVADLMKTIERIKRNFNPKLFIHGVVMTMFDTRSNLSKSVVKDVKEFFGRQIYDTVIPRNVRIPEAPSHGKPVMLYDFKSVGAQSYISLAGEFIEREKEILNG